MFEWFWHVAATNEMILGVPCGKASPVPHACEEISLAHEGNGHASSSDRSDHFGIPMVSPRKWSEKWWKVSFLRFQYSSKVGHSLVNHISWLSCTGYWFTVWYSFIIHDHIIRSQPRSSALDLGWRHQTQHGHRWDSWWSAWVPRMHRKV